MTDYRITRTPDHFYEYAGTTYPGVSNILGVIDKSGPLMAWASRKTAEAAIAMADQLPSMLATVGADGVTKMLTARAPNQRDQAAAKGTEIHALAQVVVEGGDLSFVPHAHRMAVKAYADWWRASGWQLRAAEGMVVNTRLGYGGTFDLLARDRDGKTVLADVKTGGLYWTHVLQLAAYGMGEIVQVGNGSCYRMPPPDRFVLLQVADAGVRPVEVEVGHLEREAVAAALSIFKWQITTKGKRL